VSRIFHFCVISLALASLACAAGETPQQIEVPPRMSLSEWPTIGIVTFDGEIDQKLASEATRHFVEMLQAAQPGVRIVELGDAPAVLAEVGHEAMDFEAARAMGERYGVSAVFTGLLELEQARPRIKFGDAPTSVRARMDVSGELAARLIETDSGALVWSRSSSGLANVANLGLWGGIPSFGAKAPEEARIGLVEHLVFELRHDFYSTWH
jgi:hypothetical protein